MNVIVKLNLTLNHLKMMGSQQCYNDPSAAEDLVSLSIYMLGVGSLSAGSIRNAIRP